MSKTVIIQRNIDESIKIRYNNFINYTKENKGLTMIPSDVKKLLNDILPNKAKIIQLIKAAIGKYVNIQKTFSKSGDIETDTEFQRIFKNFYSVFSLI